MSNQKEKLLKKYLGQHKTKKHQNQANRLLLKDDDIEFNQSPSSSDQSVQRKHNKRIHSSSEDQEKNEKAPVKLQGEKSHRVEKGIRKALGMKKGQQAKQFLAAVKIEGIQMDQLHKHLKYNKEAINLQVSNPSKKKKKAQKRLEKQQQRVKLEQDLEPSQSSSDLVIPQQARTIYRNKDGSIRQFSEAKQKQMKQVQIMEKLAEWQKGMKRQKNSDSQQQRIDIWDDPVRRWQAKISKPMVCKYQGYANRFDIKAGMRWDGVIRGNGFQNKYLQEMNLRKDKESRQNRQYLKNL